MSRRGRAALPAGVSLSPGSGVQAHISARLGPSPGRGRHLLSAIRRRRRRAAAPCRLAEERARQAVRRPRKRDLQRRLTDARLEGVAGDLIAGGAVGGAHAADPRLPRTRRRSTAARRDDRQVGALPSLGTPAAQVAGPRAPTAGRVKSCRLKRVHEKAHLVVRESSRQPRVEIALRDGARALDQILNMGCTSRWATW